MTPGDVHTAAGWLLVSWHSRAEMTFALPRTALLVAVDGSAISAAIWAWVLPAKIDGSTEAPLAVALPQ